MQSRTVRVLASFLTMVLGPCIAVAEESIEDRLVKTVQSELMELKESVLQEVTTQLELVRSEISEWRTDAMTASGGRMESLEALVQSMQARIATIETAVADLSSNNRRIKSLQDQLSSLQTAVSGWREPAQVQFDSGIIHVSAREFPEMMRGSRSDRRRGATEKYVGFGTKFRSVPRVMVALSGVGAPIGLGDHTLRIQVSVVSVSQYGFKYSLHTWHDTAVDYAVAEWIAVGN